MSWNYIQPFEGNRKADVALSENELDTPALSSFNLTRYIYIHVTDEEDETLINWVADSKSHTYLSVGTSIQITEVWLQDFRS